MFLPFCVTSSDLLVCLVSCTINTESVLNLRTTKNDLVSCFLPHLYAWLRQQYDTSAVVSARAHGFCYIQDSYEFFLQVDTLRTVSTHQSKECLQNKLTLTPLVSCSVHVHIYILRWPVLASYFSLLISYFSPGTADRNQME